jgi:hypothetical protein
LLAKTPPFNLIKSMFKKLTFFFFGFTILSLFFAQLSGYAFGSNVTDLIAIQAKTSANKIEISYEITQTFNLDSRGVFLTLPRNQSGIKTDYQVISVQKKKVDRKNEKFNDEKFEAISEIDELRIRVGDKNTIIIGQYIYQIDIVATATDKNQYDFTFLKDWNDPVGKISLEVNNIQQCIQKLCRGSSTKTTLNQGQPVANEFIGFISIFWVYPLGIFAVYSVIYFLWLFFAKDPNDNLVFDKPEFEPPKDIYPWQAEYLITEGVLDFKNTFLSFKSSKVFLNTDDVPQSFFSKICSCNKFIPNK